MTKLGLSIFSISGLAVLNEVLAGEQVPTVNGSLELSGSDAVTGILALIGGLLALYGLLTAIQQTIGHWRERNAETDKADLSTVDFTDDKEAGWLYGFPTIQYALGFLLFLLRTWVASLFGIIVAILYYNMILLSLNKMLP